MHQLLDVGILCDSRNLSNKNLHLSREKKNILVEDIIRECAPEVLISISMMQTMNPTVHRTIAERQYRDQDASSESDSESNDTSYSEDRGELLWSTAF